VLQLLEMACPKRARVNVRLTTGCKSREQFLRQIFKLKIISNLLKSEYQELLHFEIPSLQIEKRIMMNMKDSAHKRDCSHGINSIYYYYQMQVLSHLPVIPSGKILELTIQHEKPGTGRKRLFPVA